MYDVTRKKVFNLVAEPGQTTFDQVILPPGEYTVAVRGKTGVRYQAGVLATTDPIGLDAPADPTLSPDPLRSAPPPSTFNWMTYAQSYYAWLM